jgi:hypothetical protein
MALQGGAAQMIMRASPAAALFKARPEPAIEPQRARHERKLYRGAMLLKFSAKAWRRIALRRAQIAPDNLPKREHPARFCTDEWQGAMTRRAGQDTTRVRPATTAGPPNAG